MTDVHRTKGRAGSLLATLVALAAALALAAAPAVAQERKGGDGPVRDSAQTIEERGGAPDPEQLRGLEARIATLEQRVNELEGGILERLTEALDPAEARQGDTPRESAREAIDPDEAGDPGRDQDVTPQREAFDAVEEAQRNLERTTRQLTQALSQLLGEMQGGNP